jgi:hypothetical protein
MKVQVRPVVQDRQTTYMADDESQDEEAAGSPAGKITKSYVGGWDGYTYDDIWSGFGKPTDVLWINAPSDETAQDGYVHLTYGNEAGINALYTYAALFVELPAKKADETA